MRTESSPKVENEDWDGSSRHDADAEFDDDGPSALDKIVDLVRRSWLRTFAGAILGLVVGVAMALVFKVANPPVTTYREGITVSFSETARVDVSAPGAASWQSKYPNGSPFSPTDLLSPVVIDRVYNDNKLDSHGVRRADFDSMLSVGVFSPVMDATLERYRLRLAEKSITFVERQAIEEEFAAEIERLAGKNLIVTFTVPDSLKLPADLAAKIVADIPARWSEHFINRLGVAELPIAASTKKLFAQGEIDTLDFPLALDKIEKMKGNVSGRLNEIAKVAGAETFQASNGATLADLFRDLENLRVDVIERTLRPIVDSGLAEEPEFARAYYVSLAERAAEEERNARERAIALAAAISMADKALPVVPAAGVAETGTTQVDSGFIDRIISLSERSESRDLRQRLINQKIEQDYLAANLVELRTVYQKRAAVLSSGSSVGNPAYPQKFRTAAAQAVVELDFIWERANSLVAELSSSRLNYAKVLYRPADFGGAFSRSTSRVIDRYALIVIAAATSTGAAIGMIMAMFAMVIRRRRR